MQFSRTFLAVGLILGTQFLVAGMAGAVSYPTGEVSGNSRPYVAEIAYVEEPGDWAGETISGYCSGTFISADYVVTAAHCIEGVEPEQLYVGTGAAFEALRYCAVLSFEDHPRYKKGRISVNDIALMRVTRGCAPKKFPRLPRPGRINTKGLTLYGWGLNQDSEHPQELGYARLTDFTALGQKIYGSKFNPATQIAAGAYYRQEQIFGGACYGDSGGPLIANQNGRPILVGVVSWGSFFGKSCEPDAPTVFSRMSYYSNWVPSAVRRISRLVGKGYMVYGKNGGDGVDNDGIDFFAGVIGTSSDSFNVDWEYAQTTVPVGPVTYSFSIDSTFDGIAELTGDSAGIVDSAGVVKCTLLADTTAPLDGSPGVFIRTLSFPTACVRGVGQFAHVALTLTAGGSPETVRVDGVAFPPTR